MCVLGALCARRACEIQCWMKQTPQCCCESFLRIRVRAVILFVCVVHELPRYQGTSCLLYFRLTPALCACSGQGSALYQVLGCQEWSISCILDTVWRIVTSMSSFLAEVSVIGGWPFQTSVRTESRDVGKDQQRAKLLCGLSAKSHSSPCSVLSW